MKEPALGRGLPRGSRGRVWTPSGDPGDPRMVAWGSRSSIQGCHAAVTATTAAGAQRLRGCDEQKKKKKEKKKDR
jgi:hypothetical protein